MSDRRKRISRSKAGGAADGRVRRSSCGFFVSFELLFVLLSVNLAASLEVVSLGNKFYSDEYILQLAERVS